MSSPVATLRAAAAQLLTRREIEQITRLSTPTIYRRIAAGTFPSPSWKAGPSKSDRVMWDADVVRKWLDDQRLPKRGKRQ